MNIKFMNNMNESIDSARITFQHPLLQALSLRA